MNIVSFPTFNNNTKIPTMTFQFVNYHIVVKHIIIKINKPYAN